MSLLSAGQLAQDGDFRLKVKIAMISAAKDVAASAPTAFLDYAKRQAYAVQVLNEPDYKLNPFCFAVAANPAITSASTDSDIQFTVNSVFDSLAGVKPSDATTNA